MTIRIKKNTNTGNYGRTKVTKLRTNTDKTDRVSGKITKRVQPS